MQRFKNILFVNEPGTADTTTPQAVVELARANGARLTVCDVAYELTRSFVRLKASLERLRHQRLESLLDHLDTRGMEVEQVLLTGAPFIEVIRQVKRAGHDLVIKNAEAGGITNKRFGANDLHLMRKCPCPLWIARTAHFGAWRSIVAAVDVDPEEPTNVPLNDLILDLSIALAKQSGGTLHVTHASHAPNTALLRGLDDGAGEALEEFASEHEAMVRGLLAGRDLEGVECRVHVGRAKPEEYVLQVFREVDADLVVMGTVARTGVPGYIIGNVAERILTDLEGSALTVKPPGFETPVV